MKNQPTMLQKMKLFSQAFSEFLGRPKTIFDMKDRLRLVILFIILIWVLESIIYFLKM